MAGILHTTSLSQEMLYPTVQSGIQQRQGGPEECHGSQGVDRGDRALGRWRARCTLPLWVPYLPTTSYPKTFLNLSFVKPFHYGFHIAHHQNTTRSSIPGDCNFDAARVCVWGGAGRGQAIIEVYIETRPWDCR